MLNEFKSLINSKLHEISVCLTNDVSAKNPCLTSGKMGEALFFMYYANYMQDELYYNEAMTRLEQTFELIDEGYCLHSFSAGLSGVFWGIEHFIEQGYINSDTRKSIEEFDEYLGDKMLEDIARGDFDYLHGAIGVGLYFLKRRKYNPSLDIYLIKLIEGLQNCAIEVESDQVKWNAVFDIVSGETVPNISLSHGMSSIAIILSKLIKADIGVNLATPLLHKTINYILHQETNPAQHLSCFPSTSLERSNSSDLPSRMGWCYGDLGVGIALLQAAKVVRVDNWYKKALEVLHYSCSRKDLQTNMVMDAGLCHGTAGIAHIYHRLSLDTAFPSFKSAADYWYQQTLNLASPFNDVAGYAPYIPKIKDIDPSVYTSFLVGISGIGLSLLHAVSDIPPAWDECLLLS